MFSSNLVGRVLAAQRAKLVRGAPPKMRVKGVVLRVLGARCALGDLSNNSNSKAQLKQGPLSQLLRKFHTQKKKAIVFGASAGDGND